MLEVLQGQSAIVVQVRLVEDLLAHHPHLVLRQLVACQSVQGLLQVRLAEEVVVVEVLDEGKEESMGILKAIFFFV